MITDRQEQLGKMCIVFSIVLIVALLFSFDGDRYNTWESHEPYRMIVFAFFIGCYLTGLMTIKRLGIAFGFVALATLIEGMAGGEVLTMAGDGWHYYYKSWKEVVSLVWSSFLLGCFAGLVVRLIICGVRAVARNFQSVAS